MSSRKVRPIVRLLPILSAVYSAGVTTITTATHYLASDDLVTIRFQDVPQVLLNIAVTVTSGTTFTIVTPMDYRLVGNNVEIAFYATGQTGGQPSITFNHQTGNSGVVQSWVVGTGGAVYTIEGSLDDVHWSNGDAAVTHAGITNDTQSSTVEPAWAYLRPNITSIGAATKLYFLVSG